MNLDLQQYKKLAIDIAHKAGEIMLKHFDTDVEQREKLDKTIVTIADEAINRMVIEEIAKAFPGHAVSGEEESNEKESKHVWVCDPIDGTNPYARSIPISVFSLAYVHDGEPLVGVVYDPFMDRLYSAVKGEGAFCNETPISVSDSSLGRRAMADIEWWPEAPHDLLKVYRSLSEELNTYTIMMGSVTHAACLVASGKFEACLFAGTEGKHVDIAAVKVIVEEAGGQVTDIAGNEQRYDGPGINGAVISNGVAHDDLLEHCSRI